MDVPVFNGPVESVTITQWEIASGSSKIINATTWEFAPGNVPVRRVSLNRMDLGIYRFVEEWESDEAGFPTRATLRGNNPDAEPSVMRIRREGNVLFQERDFDTDLEQYRHEFSSGLRVVTHYSLGDGIRMRIVRDFEGDWSRHMRRTAFLDDDRWTDTGFSWIDRSGVELISDGLHSGQSEIESRDRYSNPLSVVTRSVGVGGRRTVRYEYEYTYRSDAEGRALGAPMGGSGPEAPVPSGRQSADSSTNLSGEQLFETNCSACHQGAGQGISAAFPPLAEHAAELANASRDYLPSVLVWGLRGMITVDGFTYNGIMPAHRHLRDEDIASVLNYITTAWGNAERLAPGFEPYTAQDVEAARSLELEPTEVHTQRP